MPLRRPACYDCRYYWTIGTLHCNRMDNIRKCIFPARRLGMRKSYLYHKTLVPLIFVRSAAKRAAKQRALNDRRQTKSEAREPVETYSARMERTKSETKRTAERKTFSTQCSRYRREHHTNCCYQQFVRRLIAILMQSMAVVLHSFGSHSTTLHLPFLIVDILNFSRGAILKWFQVCTV